MSIKIDTYFCLSSYGKWSMFGLHRKGAIIIINPTSCSCFSLNFRASSSVFFRNLSWAIASLSNHRRCWVSLKLYLCEGCSLLLNGHANMEEKSSGSHTVCMVLQWKELIAWNNLPYPSSPSSLPYPSLLKIKATKAKLRYNLVYISNIIAFSYNLKILYLSFSSSSILFFSSLSLASNFALIKIIFLWRWLKQIHV